MDKIILIDLETTGTDFRFDKIIEIGAIKVSGEEVIDQFCSFVDPERKLTPEITEITGIKDADLEGAGKVEEVISELEEFVGDLPLMAHNMDFDSAFLKKNGMEGEFLDSLDLACLLFPMEKKHTQEYLLKELCDTEYEAHRALEDVKGLHQLFLKLSERAEEMDERLKKEIREALKDSDWRLKKLFESTGSKKDDHLSKKAANFSVCPNRLPENPVGIPMAHLLSWMFYTETGNMSEISYWIRRKYDNFFRNVTVKKCKGDCNYFNNNERLF